MIKIYHVPPSRSLRVVWLMEELGEEYEVEQVPFPPSAEFLALNPLGSVPFIDDDGIRMGESLAILQYITGRRIPDSLCITTGPNPDPAAYAEHLQFFHFGEAGLTEPLAAVFRTRWRAPEGEKSNFTTEDQLNQVRKRLGFLDAHLADGREWVTGEKFTIADISIGFALRLAEFLELGEAIGEHGSAYWRRLQARPAYRRALEK